MKIKTEVDFKDFEIDTMYKLKEFMVDCIKDQLRLEVKRVLREDKDFQRKIRSYKEKLQQYSIEQLDEMFGRK